MEYHISKLGNDKNDGSGKSPFLTISRAAEIAEAGDIITVHEGVYREWVKPQNGGVSNENRIIYRAAQGERVIIKGSEEVNGWEKCEKDIWKITVNNELFGDYNPYAQVIDGDWLVEPRNPFRHTGEVYLNGNALYEVFSVNEVSGQEMSWYAEVSDKETIIYANFGKTEPNGELTEINVRKCCFYPEKTGRNYITVKGFEIAQAACTWAPPTAEQFGMLGANWSRGWIIENNILHDARCSGISIGKNATIEDNIALKQRRKSGYQYQIDNVFKAKEFGWSKENIGSHIVRNNTIYDCGQTGIVGHMGCVFSEIYGNNIYNIGNKCEYRGWEIAGIKLHAAIDVQIHNNYIHNCRGVSGIWLDWQTQGTRISRNLLWNNEGRGGVEGVGWGDLFVEVSHGPYMVDNNIFASERNVQAKAQGGAYVHNLFFGATGKTNTLARFTPYHYNHSTEVAGYCCIYGEDDRWYQNIFAGAGKETNDQKHGTAEYNGCTLSLEEYAEAKNDGEGGNERGRQMAYINGNCYFGGAKAFDKEQDNVISSVGLNPKLTFEGDKVYLEIDIPKEVCQARTKLIASEDLIPPRISEQPFENPDGTPMAINCDYFGNNRSNTPTPGAFEKLSEGHNKILVWNAQ